MKTWLITGSSSGIGRGIEKAVLENGDRAVITARNTDELQDLVDMYPKQAVAVSLEMTDLKSIKNVVKVTQEKFGEIDVLVNNAGKGMRSSIEEGRDQDVLDLFELNFLGQ